jgi:hypothetical protein
MQKEREFDSFDHVVFLSRRRRAAWAIAIDWQRLLSAFDRALCMQFRAPAAFPSICSCYCSAPDAATPPPPALLLRTTLFIYRA